LVLVSGTVFQTTDAIITISAVLIKKLHKEDGFDIFEYQNRPASTP